jgi:hypothetical protein
VSGCEDCRQVVCRCDEVVPPGCEARGCPAAPLTQFRDGGGELWWLCEEHGDLLAVGFETRRPRTGQEFRYLDGAWEPVIYGRAEA